MISREELIRKFAVGMKLQALFNKFHNIDEGILTVEEIDTVNFKLSLKKENGASFMMVFGAPYRYNIDAETFEILHNDRIAGWTVVERYKIISGGQ